LKKYGHEPPFAEIRAQIGKGSDQFLPMFLTPEEMREFGEALDHERSDLWKRDYLPLVKPFPAVRQLFLHIRLLGQGPALASSAKGDELEHYKKIADIEDLVEAATTADDVEKSKPHPDIFGAALKKLKLRPDQAVVVGDTRWDAEAAGKLGIKTVGVLCGGSAEATLRAAGCAAVYRDPEDLLKRYSESPLAG
jgi:phosphoglycolate phosphatase-like HAD superfamily hydrolase